jgi:putative tryptophan/tyrosine transport system substrate-binding protein
MIGRREFILVLVAPFVWHFDASAQQATMPTVGFVNAGSAVASAGLVAAFRKGLGETGLSRART